jgi:hypothetical protein
VSETSPGKLPKDKQLPAVIDLLEAAAMIGRKVTLEEVKAVTGVSKPTAIALRKKAEAAIAAKVAGSVGRAMPAGGLPPQADSTTRVGALVGGLDMITELTNAIGRVKAIAKRIELDARHARYFVLGSPDGHQYPGLCTRCGAEEVSEITVRHKPALLQVGYGDVARLEGEALKAEKAVSDIVDKYNNVVGTFYNYQALERFMTNVQSAINTVCPENARAIAKELARLQSQGS